MARVQLALNVSDVGEAVDFYRRLFGADPAKVRPGYANFALTDPPLKLVLIESPGGAAAHGALNHLGVEVDSLGEVAAFGGRARSAGLATTDGSGTCCYATQEKVWVEPEGAGERWEIYTVLDDDPGRDEMDAAGEAATHACCITG